jgi:hypothetical protein
MVEQLAEGQAEQLIQRVVDLAQAGDVSCLRMLLDRLWPPRRGQPVKLDMPPPKTSADVLKVTTSLWRAIGEGRFTPDELSALSLVAERSLQVINQADLLKRIEVLEEDRGRRDATTNLQAR